MLNQSYKDQANKYMGLHKDLTRNKKFWMLPDEWMRPLLVLWANTTREGILKPLDQIEEESTISALTPAGLLTVAKLKIWVEYFVDLGVQDPKQRWFYRDDDGLVRVHNWEKRRVDRTATERKRRQREREREERDIGRLSPDIVTQDTRGEYRDTMSRMSRSLNIEILKEKETNKEKENRDPSSQAAVGSNVIPIAPRKPVSPAVPPPVETETGKLVVGGLPLRYEADDSGSVVAKATTKEVPTRGGETEADWKFLDEFESFWGQYPNKTQKALAERECVRRFAGKPDEWKAFLAACELAKQEWAKEGFKYARALVKVTGLGVFSGFLADDQWKDYAPGGVKATALAPQKPKYVSQYKEL